MQLLRPTSKALALSSRISIRTDARGFLSLQYMIRNEDGQVCFVEFFVRFIINITIVQEELVFFISDLQNFNFLVLFSCLWLISKAKLFRSVYCY